MPAKPAPQFAVCKDGLISREERCGRRLCASAVQITTVPYQFRLSINDFIYFHAIEKKKKKKIFSMSWDAVRNREHSVKQRKSVALPVQGKLSKGYLSPAVDLSVTYFRVFSLTLTE